MAGMVEPGAHTNTRTISAAPFSSMQRNSISSRYSNDGIRAGICVCDNKLLGFIHMVSMQVSMQDRERQRRREKVRERKRECACVRRVRERERARVCACVYPKHGSFDLVYVVVVRDRQRSIQNRFVACVFDRQLQLKHGTQPACVCVGVCVRTCVCWLGSLPCRNCERARWRGRGAGVRKLGCQQFSFGYPCTVASSRMDVLPKLDIGPCPSVMT